MRIRNNRQVCIDEMFLRNWVWNSIAGRSTDITGWSQLVSMSQTHSLKYWCVSLAHKQKGYSLLVCIFGSQAKRIQFVFSNYKSLKGVWFPLMNISPKTHLIFHACQHRKLFNTWTTDSCILVKPKVEKMHPYLLWLNCNT